MHRRKSFNSHISHIFKLNDDFLNPASISFQRDGRGEGSVLDERTSGTSRHVCSAAAKHRTKTSHHSRLRTTLGSQQQNLCKIIWNMISIHRLIQVHTSTFLCIFFATFTIFCSSVDNDLLSLFILLISCKRSSRDRSDVSDICSLKATQKFRRNQNQIP